MILVLMAVATTAIDVKLLDIQAVRSASYVRMAANQDVASVTLPALRGSILASNGAELALSELRSLVFADPTEITNASAEARRLAVVLGRPASTIRSQLTAKTTYVVLAAGLSEQTGQRVASLGLAGIGVQHQAVRFHPAGGLAAPIVGGVNSAGLGYSGLEYAYNGMLAGRQGRLIARVDPQGQPVPGGVLVHQPALNGSDLLTTINEPLQYQAEQALRAAVVRTHATSGVAMVMDRRTGALLAVADISSAHGGAAESPTAAAFTSVYQPGSVMKVVTVAGALAAGLIQPGTVLTIPPALPVAGTLIRDAEQHPTEQLSITGILAQSSNIGAAEIAGMLGPQRLYAEEAKFGFTRPTAVAFPGQSAGLVPTPSHFTGTTLATMAFGEAQADTPVQVLAAYNTIANGGVYVPPRLVTATIGPHGHEHLLPATPPHRVVPRWVASAMTPMFEQVVSSGTGPNASLAGYAVAGKTGTSNVVKPGGGYSASVTNSTFVGYYPAQHPSLTEIVVVNGSTLYGAQAAAPTFSKIARDAVLDLRVPSAGPQPPPENTAVPTIAGRVDTALLGL